MEDPSSSLPPRRAGPLARLVRDLRREMRGERITVDDAARAGQGAAAVRLMALTALVVVSPLSGIPLMSSVCGLVIALSAAQALAGVRRVWVPRWLGRLSAPARRVEAALMRVGPVADWLDARVRRRWRAMRAGPARVVLLGACMTAGLAMPILELVPFSSTTLGAFVLLTSLGLLARDGLVNALAIIPLGAGLGLVVLIAS